MKSVPYGEYLYDPYNKMWFLAEKHLAGLQILLDNLKEYFEVDFVKKQEGHNFQQTAVPIQVYLDKFQALTNFNLKDYPDYNQAKKIYRKFCLLYHPDRKHLIGGEDMSKQMYELNECWSNIERVIYKQKEIEQTCLIKNLITLKILP
jgi:hypothetical protein